ncbi:hypothetical protein ACIPTZ_07795 [Pectobacterium sp. CHL-2024]|uniref:hypothetical protein n=1 Tax=Pectobacterium sp. CHL-2024 TaxID=3377079 RepID=UPI0038240C36
MAESSEQTPPQVQDNESNNTDAINHDGREIGKWESRWDKKAINHIRVDAIYVASILIITLITIFLVWKGSVFNLLVGECKNCDIRRFNQFALFFLGGMLGGTMFGIKYLYKVVARGYWNLDRRLWRVFTPFLSGVLAFTIGALIDSGMLGLSLKSSSSTFYLSLGFITGYFADSALAKMQEIANTVFGTEKTGR